MNEKDSRKKIQELYDKRITSSRNSIIAAGQWGSKEYVPLICKEIGNKIGLSKNDKVIELGCGSGVLGNWINTHCKLYVGMDISFQMLNFFLKESNNLSPIIIQGSTESIPNSDKNFDVVILNGVTMYLHNEKFLQKTFNEMLRVAKKNARIFIGENITPSGFFWELSWFQNLSPSAQILAKQYIKLRRWIARKNPKLSGKWNSIHREISPEFVDHFFTKYGKTTMSKSSASTVKQRILGTKYKGNKRVDFLIKLN